MNLVDVMVRAADLRRKLQKARYLLASVEEYGALDEFDPGREQKILAGYEAMALETEIVGDYLKAMETEINLIYTGLAGLLEQRNTDE